MEAVFRELIIEGDNAGVMQSLDMVLSHATPCTGDMVAHSLASLLWKS